MSANPVAGEAGPILVDQRFVPGEFQWDGRNWRSLGFFTLPAGRDGLEVRLSSKVDDATFVDGALSAGAVMLVDHWDFVAPGNSFSTLEWTGGGEPARVVTKTQDVYLFDAASGLLQENLDRNGNRNRYYYDDADGDGRHDELVRIQRQGGLETRIHYDAGFVSGITALRPGRGHDSVGSRGG